MERYLIVVLQLQRILSAINTDANENVPPAVFRDCNTWFSQDVDSVRNDGSFTSPNYPADYPPNTECVYTFVAKQNFRVMITFDDFVLDTSLPKCEHYVDLYAEVKGHFDFPNEKLSGRFCGAVSPGLRVSLHNVVVIVFRVRGEKGAKGFAGKFEFISGTQYGDSDTCDSTIFSSAAKHGSIISPTYPGKYPTNIACKYSLIAEVGQRIQLYFKDFDLYFGGPHCPFDTLTVFDGDSDQAPIIQKLCGLQQTLELYSRSNKLYLEFKSSDPPYAEHRGFEIMYTFNDSFVNIDKMIGDDLNAEHAKGTECDIHVRSKGESKHKIRSPNYPDPYPINTECTITLDGMRGNQKLEHASLRFKSFRVDSETLNCTDSNVTLYYSSVDSKDFKAFCSPMKEPQLFVPYESTGSRLIVVFHSNETSGPGFEAEVSFKTNFGITGTKIVSTTGELCHFEFTKQDESRDKNTFNSPRFPDDYFANTTCIYDIKAGRNQRILIEFERFDLYEPSSDADNIGGDRLEMYNANKDNNTFILYGNYTSVWSDSVPGPTISQSNWVRVIFYSDAKGTKTGFKAFYKFLPLRDPNAPCRPFGPHGPENLVCVERVDEGTQPAVITSPNFGKYPVGLDRLWIIRAPEGYRVLLEPIAFEIEGKMRDDGKYSQCQQAVVRVYDDTDVTGKELCGDVIKNSGVRQFVSTNNILYLSFITSPYQVMGLAGFRFSWTAFKDDASCADPNFFKCSHNQFCISKHLRCNKLPNCGYWDTSDEDRTVCKQ